MADPLPVDDERVETEVTKARRTRYFLTGMIGGLAMLVAGLGIFRYFEQREDCIEQRAARAVSDADRIALVTDFRDALVATGNGSPEELDPVVDDIIRRQQARWAGRPPPSACT